VPAELGSMTVEVAFLLVLLVVPLFYLVGTLGRLQAGAYAVTAAAREAGRTFVTADDLGSAEVRADAAAALALDAHGFGRQDAVVRLGCGSVSCLTPGSTVVVDAELAVPLPLVPDFMRSALPTTITLTAQHLEPVDAFREDR
jgi:hypothetical protein